MMALALSAIVADEATQTTHIVAPSWPKGFQSQEFTLPEGFSFQVVAGPPLVTHPTIKCFTDTSRFFVFDGAGLNMSVAELKEHLPNRIHMLEGEEGDGVLDKFRVFGDEMIFLMEAAGRSRSGTTQS